jgi:peptide/nickel transport system substrate-binding protein
MNTRAVIRMLLIATLTLGLGNVLAQSTVTVLQGVDATTLDPHRTQAAAELNILAHIFEGLVMRADDMSIQPRLATSWRTIDDVTWEFTLRDGVTFSNGEAFNAEAARYSIERAVAAGNADIQQLQFERVEVVDDMTVRVITSRPSPVTLTALLAAPMVPPGYYASLAEGEAAISPIGSGPYVLREWVRDERVVLDRRADYWGDPAPHDVIIWRPVPESSTRLAELEVGAADIVANIAPEAAQRLDALEHVNILSTLGGQRFYIGLRHHEGGPLADPRVRQALNHAVDVQLIIDSLLGGLGEPRASLLNEPHLNQDLEPFGYDPERAKALLAEAGYADGFEMTLMGPSGRYTRDLEVGQAVAAFIREIGIDVEFVPNEWGRYTDLMLANELRDAWLLASGPYFDGQLEYNVFMGALEQLTWHNERAMELWQRLLGTVDEGQRAAILDEMQSLMLEDPPVILLYRPIDLYGVNADLDWQPRPDGRIHLY